MSIGKRIGFVDYNFDNYFANVYTGGDTPFAASVTSTQVTRIMLVDTSKLFINMAAGILSYFDS